MTGGKVTVFSVGNKGNKTVHEPLSKEKRKAVHSVVIDMHYK